MLSLPRAAIYVRVSSDLQEDNSSLPTQEAACRQYCAEHGYHVAGVFSDVHTGAQYRERPGLSQLRELVRQKAIDVVVCYAVDRLSRNQAHLYILVEELAEHGCRLEFVTEKFEDTAVGRFILAAKSFAAEIEREKIKERSLRGRQARAEAGKLLGTAPAPLYGYQWADSDRSRYVPDPATAPIVTRIYAMALQGMGVTAIANALTADGIPTPWGKERWALTTVWRILTNPAYTGSAYAFAWKATASGKSYRRRYDAAIALPDGVVPPLVDRATFDTVQERLRHNRERSARRNRAPELWLLRGGFARCGVCGATMTGKFSNGQPAYVCGNRTRHPRGQPRPCIEAAEIDALAWEAVRVALTRDDVLQHGLHEAFSEQPGRHEVEGAERAIARLKRQQANLAQAIALASDETAVGALLAEMERVTASLRELEAERAALARQAETWAHLRERYQELGRWRRHVGKRLEAMDYRERRWLLELLGLVARVYPVGDPEHERVEFTLALPLGELPIDVGSQNRSAQ